MSGQDTIEIRAEVYLRGDSAPLLSLLEPEALLARVSDVERSATLAGCPAWVRVPGRYGDSIVRPDAIAAILPPGEDNDDE